MLREQGMGATCIHSLGLLYCGQIRIRGLSFTILGGERYFLLWGYISVVKFFLKQVCTVGLYAIVRCVLLFVDIK